MTRYISLHPVYISRSRTCFVKRIIGGEPGAAQLPLGRVSFAEKLREEKTWLSLAIFQ